MRPETVVRIQVAHGGSIDRATRHIGELAIPTATSGHAVERTRFVTERVTPPRS